MSRLQRIKKKIRRDLPTIHNTDDHIIHTKFGNFRILECRRRGAAGGTPRKCEVQQGEGPAFRVFFFLLSAQISNFVFFFSLSLSLSLWWSSRGNVVAVHPAGVSHNEPRSPSAYGWATAPREDKRREDHQKGKRLEL